MGMTLGESLRARYPFKKFEPVVVGDQFDVIRPGFRSRWDYDTVLIPQTRRRMTIVAVDQGTLTADDGTVFDRLMFESAQGTRTNHSEYYLWKGTK